MVCRHKWIMGVLVLTFAVMPVLALAAEHGGKEHGGTGAAASGASSDTGEGTSGDVTAPDAGITDTTPAATQPETTTTVPTTPPPALKPIVITFSGDLSSMDAKATPPTITVKDRYGVTKEIAVPGEAKIMQGAASKTVADLKVNDNLTVEYVYDVATGKRTAQIITVGEATPATS